MFVVINSDNLFAIDGFISTRMDKQINTYLFNIDAIVTDSSDIGYFYLYQDYSGNGLIADGVSFRDEEDLKFVYNYPIVDNFQVGVLNYGSYVSDQRSNTLSELQRFGSMFTVSGGKLDNGLSDGNDFDIKDWNFNIGIGGENNERLQVNSPGFRSVLSGNMAFSQIENIGSRSLEFGTENDYLELNQDRTNLESKSSASYTEVFSLNDRINIGAFYNILDRDLLGRLTDNQRIENPSILNTVENRIENRLGGSISLNVGITDWLTSQTLAELSNAEIVRDYKNPIVGLELSNISRVLEENSLNFNTQVSVELENYQSNTGLHFFSRTESNNTERVYEISNTDFENLSELESLRDNQQISTKIFSRNRYELDKSNILTSDLSATILRYDTPSEQNNDDRDELTVQLDFGLSHRFSDVLTYGIKLNFFANHFVYLKSEYSAQNRWNRILSLKQSFLYDNNIISYRPSIDIIANYTSFDYEGLSENVNSFSLRQINYSDTTTIKLTNTIGLESNLLLRYYERGLLFWNDFAETPENANFERFGKILLTATDELSKYGLGMRVYVLEQERIGPGAINNFGNFEQFSWGPEVFLEMNFQSGNFFRLSGWYEYQNTSGRGLQTVPNVFLTSNIIL